MPNLKLAIAIINHLKEEAKNTDYNADTRESLEVAVQCLQTAYDLESKDPKLIYNPAISLESIFTSAFPNNQDDDFDESQQPVEKAERMKNLGNNLMKSGSFEEAIRHYTAALDIAGANAVYFCNRAAAHSRLNNHESAIADCTSAIEIDPNYAKAYGRMGLAYISLQNYEKAVEAFEKALRIDPGNENYATNLKIALEKREKPAGTPPGGMPMPGMPNIDWNSLFNNPDIRNMASTIMQDQNVVRALSGITSSFSQAPGSNAGATSSGTGAAPAANMNMLFEAGQYLASQLQATNPDLVEQLRQTTQNNPSNPGNTKDSPK